MSKENKIPLWLFWEYSSQHNRKTPALVKLCRKTVAKYCQDDFEIKLLGPREANNLIELPDDIWNWENIAMRADVIRARLLKEFGGLWLDSDLIVLRDLKDVKKKLKEHEFVGYKKESHGDNHIPNNFMATKPNSDTIKGYVQEQNRLIYEEDKLEWNGLGAKALTPNVENAYLYREEQIQPIPWQEQEKFYKDIDFELPDDALVMVYFNNGQAARESIPDLRFIIEMKKIWEMDIFLVDVLKRSLQVNS